jgi:hypothetical protein
MVEMADRVAAVEHRARRKLVEQKQLGKVMTAVQMGIQAHHILRVAAVELGLLEHQGLEAQREMVEMV